MDDDEIKQLKKKYIDMYVGQLEAAKNTIISSIDIVLTSEGDVKISKFKQMINEDFEIMIEDYRTKLTDLANIGILKE